jgi:aryl-alcohol dehydrogenase-like predicted oxidoreductase
MRSLYGDNEALLGKWFKCTGKRDQIFLATKFGYASAKNFKHIDSSAGYCKKACEKSLETLGVDYIDLCELSFLLANTSGYCLLSVKENKGGFTLLRFRPLSTLI